MRLRDAPRIAGALLEHFASVAGQSYKRTVGASALVRDADRRVLIVRTGYRQGWSLPGGHIGRAESLEEGLAREVREETGYAIRVGPLLVVDVRERGTVSFVFAATVVGGGPDLAPLEIRALRWAREDDLATVRAVDRSRLAESLAAAREQRIAYLAAPTIAR